MINRIRLIYAKGTDPYRNLALERYLVENVEDDTVILYLWQNAHTVVIGRNQNPWKECKVNKLEEDGGHLTRRLSGGGAVYHDLGNLNFTFIVSEEEYSIPKQLSVVQKACEYLGLKAEVSGRNDVLIDGRKFSGNAFYKSNGKAYHHGTLLVDVNTQALAKYLTPSKAKLEAKGVDSVRARVINLIELTPDLTIDHLRDCMARAFEETYGMKAEVFDVESPLLDEYEAHMRSFEWLFGKTAKFGFTCSDRFGWGDVDINLQVENGIISDAKIYSDSMDWEFAGILNEKLPGTKFNHQAIEDCIRANLLEKDIADDLVSLIEKQEI